MFRIKHVIPTVAVTLATAALVTPAAQARPVTGPPSAESSNAAAIAKAVQRTHRDLQFQLRRPELLLLLRLRRLRVAGAAAPRHRSPISRFRHSSEA